MRTAIFGKRLDRYIFRQLLLALIAVTSGLTALIWLTQSLRFVELVVNHGLSFGVFLRLTALLIPSFVAVILPITTFVVVQFVYQRLAGDRELTVMRARRAVAVRPGPARDRRGIAGDGGRLRAQSLAGARKPVVVPPVPMGDSQSHRRLPGAGRRVHPGVGQD